MRTLVIGIPLPQPSFDNYSFLSAPSFSDYPRMIVDMAAVSRAVEEVVAGSGQHKTYAGQPVVNGPSSAEGFGMADLLAMRRREAERFLARGGVLAALAHPDVPHSRIDGLPGWSRYAWLPLPEAGPTTAEAPQGFRYQEHLLPGFGNQGVDLEDGAHPFAPYVEVFGPRLVYRAYADEGAPGFQDYARVFARSPGGAAVGVELTVGEGWLVLLPPLARFEEERPELAETLLRCFERWGERQRPETPEWMRKDLS